MEADEKSQVTISKSQRGPAKALLSVLIAKMLLRSEDVHAAAEAADTTIRRDALATSTANNLRGIIKLAEKHIG